MSLVKLTAGHLCMNITKTKSDMGFEALHGEVSKYIWFALTTCVSTCWVELCSTKSEQGNIASKYSMSFTDVR